MDHTTIPLILRNIIISLLLQIVDEYVSRRARIMGGTMRRERRPRAATKKELIIESGDYCKGFVEVGPHDTLADVRALIHDEFDDDMLPTCATFSSMIDYGDNNANDAARDAF
jgi:hypothetical protein